MTSVMQTTADGCEGLSSEYSYEQQAVRLLESSSLNDVGDSMVGQNVWCVTIY